jgi:hypothetical protein
MEVMVKIGEFIVIQGCVIIIFVVLAALLNIKIGFLVKILQFFGIALACMCVGAFFGDLVSATAARFGGILGLVIGFVLAISSLSST